MQHPIPLLVLGAAALLTAVRVLQRSNRSALGQILAALVIGGSVVFGVLVQTSDLIDDTLEAPGMIALSIGLVLAAVFLPWHRTPAPPG
jgi:hypothetical protein